MQILNIAGYLFTPLNDLAVLRMHFQALCREQALKGTILLGQEGININLAGTVAAIAVFKNQLANDERFATMRFRESYSDQQPFKRLKVKLRKEIITLRQPAVKPTTQRAPSISPETLQAWLNEQRDITLLDTRNDYEVRFGTFANAVNLHLNDFCEFGLAAEKIERDKPIVMFCTGGIRCEKAALHLMNQGFEEVYQLDGGILNYFEKVGGAHYEGECFVFDERVALDAHLKSTGIQQCRTCQGPAAQPVTCTACAT